MPHLRRQLPLSSSQSVMRSQKTDLDGKSLAFLSHGKEFKIFRSTLHGTQEYLSGPPDRDPDERSALVSTPTSLRPRASSHQAELGTGRG